MAAFAGTLIRRRRPSATAHRRCKTTSAQHVAARPTDATFEKLMNKYKHLLKVISVQDLILSSPSRSVPLTLLSAVAQRLRLHPSALHFLRTFPHVFSLVPDPVSSQPIIRLTPAAAAISLQESAAAANSRHESADRLQRLLSLSSSRSVPLRAIFRVWRELGLPDDFEDSVLRRNPSVFSLRPNPREINTHLLELSGELKSNQIMPDFIPAVQEWRSREGIEGRFEFKQGIPPGMRLSKNFRIRLKEWQQLPYVGPFEVARGRRSKAGMREAEKRAVGIAHEFLSLTVEKMVEVEKISQFRKWFGIELNVRDMFVDHPGIFYLSTKGKRHTVFLREAYDRGRLIESNPIYEARMRMLDLVMLRRRGEVQGEGNMSEEEEEEEEGNEEEKGG